MINNQLYNSDLKIKWRGSNLYYKFYDNYYAEVE